MNPEFKHRVLAEVSGMLGERLVDQDVLATEVVQEGSEWSLLVTLETQVLRLNVTLHSVIDPEHMPPGVQGG